MAKNETGDFQAVWKLYEDGRYQEFIDQARQWLKKEPESADAARLRGTVGLALALSGRYDEALDWFKRHLQEWPNDWHEDTLRLMEVLQGEKQSAARKRYFEVRRRFEEAEGKPSVQAYDRVAAAVDETLSAMAAPSEAVAYGLHLVKARSRAAALKVQAGENRQPDLTAYDEVWSQFRRDAAPLKSPWLYLDLARGLYRVPYWHEADPARRERHVRAIITTCLEGLEAVQDRDVRALLDIQIGYAHMSLGEPDEALEAFERARDREAVSVGAWSARAMVASCLAFNDRLEEALAIFEEMRREAPKSSFTWQTALHLGHVVATSDPDRARGFFDEVINNAPGSRLATFAQEAIEQLKRPILMTKRLKVTEWPTGGYRPDDAHRVSSRMRAVAPLTGPAVTNGKIAVLRALLEAGKVTQDVHDREVEALKADDDASAVLNELQGRLEALAALYQKGDLDSETFLAHYTAAQDQWYHRANILPNGDFEELADDAPPPRLVGLKHWREVIWGQVDVGHSRVDLDREVKRTGTHSLRFSSTRGPSSIELKSPRFMCRRDDSLRIRVWVKAQGLRRGHFGTAGSLHFFKSEDDAWPVWRLAIPEGTYDWMPLESRLNIFGNIPEGREEPCFLEVQFYGEGTLWVDDITVVPATRR